MFDLDKFPKGSEMLDVDGIPVVLSPDNDVCVAVDTDPPRQFNLSVAYHNGYIVDKSTFLKLISSILN